MSIVKYYALIKGISDCQIVVNTTIQYYYWMPEPQAAVFAGLYLFLEHENGTSELPV